MSNRLKKKQLSQNKIVSPANQLPKLDYPVFCFRHLQPFPKHDFEFYAHFVERLNKLCQLSWTDIYKSAPHSYGVEKIPVSKIKPSKPPFVTPEIKELTVFRATGNNRPFLGLRADNVFHVIFVEERFGDIYDH